MKQIKKTIPNKLIFKNKEKEAKFWEENFDYEFAKGKLSKVTFAKNLSESLNIRLDPETITIIRNEAKLKGLGPTQLIRMWIMEKIRGSVINSTKLSN